MSQKSETGHMRMAKVWRIALMLAVATGIWCHGADANPATDAGGDNPNPVQLRRPVELPLSVAAQLGEKIFHDSTLSASGKMSCASCHSAEHDYGPPDGAPAQLGGPQGGLQGGRAVPGLRYAYRTPWFSIGPEVDETETETQVDLNKVAAQSVGLARTQKTVGSTASAVAMVPQGGQFWDGRVNNLENQAIGPLLNPVEMANPDSGTVAAKLRAAPYAQTFKLLFGPAILDDPTLLVDEAMIAVARYEQEDPSFHPYTSKYDYWLEGKARLSDTELRGLRLFEDKDKANCAGCHLDRPGKDGAPPMFTDFQYEALGVPRNRTLKEDQDPAYFDLGVCGPARHDISAQTQYCGMFRTPTLRNTATRKVFFHNGVYHSLDQVLAFYAFRDVQPEKIYPKGVDGKLMKFDDVPEAYLANVDVVDPPFDRKLGQPPAMTDQDMRDIIAFLGTLTDGYQAEPGVAAR